VISAGDREALTYQFTTPMNQPHDSTDNHPFEQYEIYVKGHLDQRWNDWFEGFAMA